MANELGETAALPAPPKVAGRAGPAGRAVDPTDTDEQPDDLEVAVKARVLQTLFGAPARPPMLGRYVVLGPLGQGGMGTVLEAFDRTLDRRVAIKVLHEDLGQEHAARLLREAQAMAKLSHPNVVQVFEADTIDDQPFVAMELVQGQTLRQWIRQTPRPTWRQCVEVFIQAGQGLAAAHAQGLIHRDFKPSNALIDDQGRVRVLDFGLARRTEVDITDDERPNREGDTTEDRRPLVAPGRPPEKSGTMRAPDRPQPPLDPVLARPLTKTGVVMGTPAYMPPEQLGGREADARSDQFSFCVSLYEAIYGERPFEGGTLTGLMTSMTNRALRPIPRGSGVPTRLRSILMRGLAASPVERWPSMDALLHQLRTLVVPHARRWMAVGVTTGLVALGTGLALGQYVQVKDRCTGALAQLDGLWDDARRQQVRAAILGTERSFAPDTWARIESRLDAYAANWVGKYVEICEATSVRGEQSQEALGLRMHCLDRRRTALRATVDVLADADAEVVTNAVELVAGLPTLTRCDDLRWLEQQGQRVPPPEDPQVATAVQAQRARLADIAAMHEAGRYADALDALDAVVQHAQALDYPPLWAEALYRRGALRDSNGQYAEAEQDLRQAHALAVVHHHNRVALDTAVTLTFVVGYHLNRHAEGQQWGEMEALPLAQRIREPLEEAQSLGNLGNVFHAQGDYDQAKLHHQRALAIRQEALGPNHPRLANSLGNLGNVSVRRGDYDQARAYYQRSLAIFETALGPDHPHVANSHTSLGDAFAHQGDHDQARDHYQRALTIFEEVLGPDHSRLAYPLIGLATVALDTDDPTTAREYAERALSVREGTAAPALLAEARFALARALWSMHGERARACALAQQARDGFAEHGKGRDDDLAEVETWLAAHRVE
ncbi:MAG: tetratricopeptide repeat protein [Myxococcota bacterium]